MTTEYKRVKHAQTATEVNALANIKTRELRHTTDTKRLVSKLEDGTATYEGGYSTRYLERYATLAAAITAIGSENVNLVISKPITLTANATVPDNIYLDIKKGGIITLAGFTLTINGGIKSASYQVFSLPGVVSGTSKLDGPITPYMFGAVDDGTTLFTYAQYMYDWASTTGGEVVWDGDTFYVKQIEHPSNLKTIITPSTTILWSETNAEGIDGGGNQISRSAFRVWEKDHVEICGGGTIDSVRFRTAGVQNFKFGIDIRDGDDIYVHDLTIKNCDGDGIYVGTTVNDVAVYPTNVVIERIISENHQRQGISVIAGYVTVRDCEFKDIGQVDLSEPGDGIDIEPDSDYTQLNVLVENCLSKNCKGGGFTAYGRTVDGSQDPNKKVSIIFKNNRDEDCYSVGMRVSSIFKDGFNVVIDGHTSLRSGLSGLMLSNISFRSGVRLQGTIKLLNSFTRTLDSTCPFPYYFSGSTNPETRVDAIVYANTISDQDSLNGGLGNIMGNIHIEELSIEQYTTDINPYWSNTYAGSSGSAYPTIKNVVIENLYLQTPSSKLPTFDNDYAYDVVFKNIYKILPSNLLEETVTYTNSSGNLNLVTSKDFRTRMSVLLTAATSTPTGTSSGNAYWVTRVSASNYYLSTTYDNAINGVYISYTDDGIGTQTAEFRDEWIEAQFENTTNKTLSNDTDQNILNVNTGAVAVVKYTVPGAQAAADRQQRFKIENRETVGTIITLASGDYLVLEDGKQVSTIFTYTPYARIEFEKKDVAYWQVTKMLGDWYYNDVVDVSDGNYSVSQVDNGKVLTDSSATADRTFSLPEDDAENTLIGFEVTLHNRSASYRMIIDPPVAYTILGLETSSGGRIQSGAQGSTITLKYTGGSTYCVVSKTGAWVDLDSTTSPINASRNIGNQFFSGYVQNSVTDSITASTTQTQGQGLLTTQNNFVTVCANANDTVTLPASFLGMEVYIKNEGAQTLRVYPNTSAQINALGVNNPTTIAAGASATFRAKSTVSWHT